MVKNDGPTGASSGDHTQLTADEDAGTRDHSGPLDVGSVLVLGAGAVASALAYWARELETGDEPWDFVDGDLSLLHNTNRCLTMTAQDTSWAGVTPTSKAEAIARAVGGRPHVQWYDEWLPEHQARHDVVLCLANERGVRPFVAGRGEPLLLHATTSANWTAELHRHLADRDDCPACRLPDTRTATPMCATGPVEPTKPDSPDAALPFLSAAAGLLLAAALANLADGHIEQGMFNHWQWDLTFPEPLIQANSWPPSSACRHVQPPAIRSIIQSQDPRRWDVLDTATD